MQTTCKNRRLSAAEQVFCNEYIANLNLEQNDRIRVACEASGCKRSVFKHEAVQDEINERISSIQSHKIASAQEILEFYTKVMRGELTDQFGLDLAMTERLKGADALAKRIVDQKETDNSFTIKLVRED